MAYSSKKCCFLSLESPATSHDSVFVLKFFIAYIVPTDHMCVKWDSSWRKMFIMGVKHWKTLKQVSLKTKGGLRCATDNTTPVNRMLFYCDNIYIFFIEDISPFIFKLRDGWPKYRRFGITMNCKTVIFGF